MLARDEPIFARPDLGAPKRGAAAQHAHLPWFAETAGSGCGANWVMVGPLAWVCSSRVRPSPHSPIEPRSDFAFSGGDGLPYRYFFVGPTGATAFSFFPEQGEQGIASDYLPGFALALVRVVERAQGDAYGLTSKGLWIAMRDLVPVRPVPTLGIILRGSLAVAWVHRETAPVYREPNGTHLPGRRLDQFTQLAVLDRQHVHGQTWFRIGEDEWVRGQDVRSPSPADPPAGLADEERWVDVDLAEQVLTAYQGVTPVFAALVSTGKGSEKSDFGTPRGEHRIWVKIRSTDMDNLEDEEARRYYAMQDVPWVMYFARGYGLHGTFWHRSFGRRRSHGCVNLAPLDAQWLFFWTAPNVPAGWTAALPTQVEPGTRVRVR